MLNLQANLQCMNIEQPRIRTIIGLIIGHKMRHTIIKNISD